MADSSAAPSGRAADRAGIVTRLDGGRVVFGVRAGVLLGVAAFLAANTLDQPGQRLASGVLVACAVLSAVMWSGALRRNAAVYVLPVVDVVAAAGVAAADHSLWTPAVVYAAAALCQSAVFVGRNAVVRLVALTAVAFAGVGVWIGWRETLPGLVGLALVAAVLVPLVYTVVQRNRGERGRLQRLLDGVEAVVWELDRTTQQFTYVSGHAQRFGLSSANWLAYPTAWLEFVHPDDRPQVGVQSLIERAERNLSIEIRAGQAPGYERVYRINTTLVGSGHPSERSVRGVMVDISDLRKSESLIRHQARHDALTGLANRAAVVTQVAHELARRQPHVALLMLDLDRFKEVNDALGHHRGDYLLQEVAKRLTACLPEDAFVGRLGGDEFAVVVPLADHDPEHGEQCASWIVDALCVPVVSDGLTMQIGVSIGIAIAPQHGHDQDQLFRRADMTMYIAKRSGGGWAVWRPEYEEESARSFHVATALRSAIDDGAITVEYQPRVSVATNRVLGFEALARWRDPVLGAVPPNEFVAAAQVAGLSLRLVSTIMRTAIRDHTRLRAADPALSVAVNVTTTDLVMQGFEEMLFEELDRAGLPHGALILELSEGEAIQNAKLLHQVLTRLGDRGVRLSIDDFGQGYSSMDRLRSLPLNEIKIDQAFVARLRQDPTDRAIVDSIVQLGHNLALDVVAEGVEDNETLDELRRLRCDAYQGRLFRGAMTIDAAESLVRWQQPDPTMRAFQRPAGDVPGLLRPGA